MRSFRDLSIHQKLGRLIMVASLTALGISALALIAYDVYTMRELLVQRVRADAEIIGFNCISPLLSRDAEAAASTLAALRAEPHVESGGIYSKEGHLFASYVRRDVVGGSAP